MDMSIPRQQDHYGHYEVIPVDGLWYVMEQATLHLSKAYRSELEARIGLVGLALRDLINE